MILSFDTNKMYVKITSLSPIYSAQVKKLGTVGSEKPQV